MVARQCFHVAWGTFQSFIFRYCAFTVISRSKLEIFLSRVSISDGDFRFRSGTKMAKWWRSRIGRIWCKSWVHLPNRIVLPIRNRSILRMWMLVRTLRSCGSGTRVLLIPRGCTDSGFPILGIRRTRGLDGFFTPYSDDRCGSASASSIANGFDTSSKFLNSESRSKSMKDAEMSTASSSSQLRQKMSVVSELSISLFGRSLHDEWFSDHPRRWLG